MVTFSIKFESDVKLLVEELIRYKKEGKNGKQIILDEHTITFRKRLGDEIDNVLELCGLAEELNG